MNAWVKGLLLLLAAVTMQGCPEKTDPKPDEQGDAAQITGGDAGFADASVLAGESGSAPLDADVIPSDASVPLRDGGDGSPDASPARTDAAHWRTAAGAGRAGPPLRPV